MSFWILLLLLVSGSAIVGILFRALTGKRDDGTVFNPLGSAFWRPPRVPEDEWKKWGEL